ncbi:MAG: hypothetical protein EVA85_06255 [Rhodobacteraceae bacterium]|nr:MAG: hypothetical protein EVA85_06255 [Paracoccaceae bacterium]
MLKFISSILVLVFLTTNFLWSNEIRLNGTNNSNTKFTKPEDMTKSDWFDPFEMERSWIGSIVRIPNGLGKSKLSNIKEMKKLLNAQMKKFPTVIFLHGCYGIHSGSHHRLKFLADNGFLVIAPVSFARKKYPKSCDIYTLEGGLYRGTINIRQFDAKYAIIALSELKFVDHKNIILMGHSQGGITAATLRVNNIEQKLKARVIEGWNCTPDVWPEYSGMNAEKDELILSLVGHSDPWFSYSNYKLGCGPLLNQNNGSKGIVYKEGFLRYEHAPLDYKKPKEELLNFLTQVIRK